MPIWGDLIAVRRDYREYCEEDQEGSERREYFETGRPIGRVEMDQEGASQKELPRYISIGNPRCDAKDEMATEEDAQ